MRTTTPKTEEDYKSLAKERGIRWVGDTFPKNTKTLTNWRCKQGHVYQSTYNWISSLNQQCPTCSGKRARRLTEEIFSAEATKRGVVWLGDKVVTSTQKTKWMCASNHIFYTSLVVVRSAKDTPCPYCKKTRGGREYISPDFREGVHKKIERELNIRSVNTPPYPGLNEKSEWECERGHRWSATVPNIEKCFGTGRNGCPVCSGKYKRTEEHYNAFEGLEWIGVAVPKTTLTHTEWLCPTCGGTFFASYNQVRMWIDKYNTGCPTCRREKVK